MPLHHLAIAASIAITVLAAKWCAAATAEDRVYLRAASGQGESRVVGTVEEFTGVELVLRHPGGRAQTYPADRVLRVESDWSAPHQLGSAKFQQHAFQESLAAYLEALRAEQRKWVQREQLAAITWCYRNLGQLEKSSASFLALYRNDPATRHISAIPLVWGSQPPDVAMERRADVLLADSRQPAGQLIGASWLLTTVRRAEALQTLRSLSNAEDARIIFLAKAQTWRTQQATVTAADVDRMQSRVAAMPTAIRAGPYSLLATALSRLGRPDEAALAWMRIPINFPEDRTFAAESLLAAAQELETANRIGEARGLYREVSVDFADTPQAETARQHYETKVGS